MSESHITREQDIYFHCGPIRHPDMDVYTDNDSVQVCNYNFPNSGAKLSSWQAEWVWLNRSAYPEFQTSPFTDFCSKDGHHYAVALLRKEFTLDSEPTKVTAWVSGDTKYRLYVNGKMAGRGPSEIGGDWGNKEAPNWWYYDNYDLTPLFKKGANVITAEVSLQGEVQADYSMGQGGFLFEAEVTIGDGSTEIIKSDSSWRGIRGEAFISPTNYDAKMNPTGWYDANFNDSGWQNVDVLCSATEGRWNLITREIPPLMEARILPKSIIDTFGQLEGRIEKPDSMLIDDMDSSRIKHGKPVTFWLDFGKEVVGYAQFSVNGKAGTSIYIAYEEIKSNAPDARRGDSYILQDGLQNFEAFHLRGFQYLQITIDFNGINEPLDIFNIAVNFTSYPVSYGGEFTCSDDSINKIWKVGRWTDQICMQAYHLDSPIHQEGLGCTGDYMIEALINYYAFGDPWLAREDILRTSYLLEQKNGVMFHTSYTLLWIQMLMDYYDYTGDDELVKKVAPTVYKVLDLFGSYIGKTGLMTEAPNYMFMDWINVDSFSMHHPPSVIGQGYMSAFYYKALLDGARISTITGEKKDYIERANAIKQAFNKELWIDDKGLYCNGLYGITEVKPNDWLPADVDKLFFSQHTNALAVLYDIAPKSLHKDIISRVMSDDSLTQCQPYFMHFLLSAIAHSGLFDRYGLKQIRRWQRLLDEHDTSLKESWDMGDYSHAWSGTPTYQLSARVLGITPKEPKFAVVSIKPIMGDLKWAKGEVPTTYGKITISWERTESGFSLNVTIPRCMKSEINIPKENSNFVVFGNGDKIWEDHSLISGASGIISADEDEEYVIFIVEHGSYNFELRK